MKATQCWCSYHPQTVLPQAVVHSRYQVPSPNTQKPHPHASTCAAGSDELDNYQNQHRFISWQVPQQLYCIRLPHAAAVGPYSQAACPLEQWLVDSCWPWRCVNRINKDNSDPPTTVSWQRHHLVGPGLPLLLLLFGTLLCGGRGVCVVP
jgi:hypothetical protein